MKQIIIPISKKSEDIIEIQDVKNIEQRPIFAMDEKNKLAGMVIKESRGYILKVSATTGSYGYCSSIKELIEKGRTWKYKFYLGEAEI